MSAFAFFMLSMAVCVCVCVLCMKNTLMCSFGNVECILTTVSGQLSLLPFMEWQWSVQTIAAYNHSHGPSQLAWCEGRMQ